MTRLSAAEGAMALVWLAAHIPADLEVMLEATPDGCVVLVYEVRGGLSARDPQVTLDACRRLAKAIGAAPQVVPRSTSSPKSVRHVWTVESPIGVPCRLTTFVPAGDGVEP